jgi:general L-amino acid transport system permease protein
MSNHDYIRTENAPLLPAPSSEKGAWAWIHANLFPNWWNTILTLLSIYIAFKVFSVVIDFTLISAVFTGDSGKACIKEGGGHMGACWPFIGAKFDQFVYGRYPLDERWRVNVVYFIGIGALVPALMPSLPFKKWNVLFLIFVYPVMTFFLLSGGYFGLVTVETPLWGGLLVTLVVAVTGIVASLPIGILLALGRRSKMPTMRLFSVVFIEFWRGVPLITVLFMSSVMLPLFLPEGTQFDKLLRCLIGVALFSAAYMAEVVRGGLQAIPRGQYEGAMALGISYWKMMGLIVLPQALKMVIPGIVNTFIGLFKDTTLVLIIGLFDLLGIIQLNFTDPVWITPVTSHTGYVFAAMVFWVFCFSMSRYSIFMENRLHTGHKR